MDQLSGSLRERSLLDVVARLRAGWRSGTLLVRSGGQTRRFTFVDGDLYLPASHSLARQMGQLLTAEAQWLDDQAENRGDSEEPPHRPPLRSLIGRIADVLSQLREGDYEFQEGEHDEPDELVGPLWSTLLVVQGAAPQVSGDLLLDSLGDEDAIVVGRVAPDAVRRLGVLGADLTALLHQIETPATLGDLRRRGGERTLELTHRLRAAGLVTLLEPAHDRGGGGPSRSAGPALAPALADKLSARIADALGRQPPAGDPATHRHEVAELLSRLGSLDHYELLGVTPLADERQVHEAFERLGRLVHPLNATRLGWVGREGVLRLLFERAAGAYTVLSDPARRTDYNKEAGIRLGQEVSPERRQKEIAEMADGLFRRASQHVEHEDYFLAVELLKQAISLQPRAEFYGLLGQVQRRNPKWLRDAQESFRRAIQLKPEDAELRIELARLQERAGDAEAAKASYRAALERRSDDAGAVNALRRLERYAAAGRVQSKGGWVSRLLSRFGFGG